MTIFHTYRRNPTQNITSLYNRYYFILVTGDEKARFVEIDCAAAAQNILLVAESLGIGSHIMTSSELLFESKKGNELKKEIGVPDGYKHICAIALGYKDETAAVKLRNEDVINYV